MAPRELSKLKIPRCKPDLRTQITLGKGKGNFIVKKKKNLPGNDATSNASFCQLLSSPGDSIYEKVFVKMEPFRETQFPDPANI